MAVTNPANDTDSEEDAARNMKIAALAKTFPSALLRAAADEAFARELEASVKDYPCDEVIK